MGADNFEFGPPPSCGKTFAKLQGSNYLSVTTKATPLPMPPDWNLDCDWELEIGLLSNQLRNVKDNKKGFFKYVSSQRKTMGNVGLLLEEVHALVTKDTGKAESPNAFFPSVFTAKANLLEFQTLKARNSEEKKTLPWSRRIGLMII
ncbi:hypothetical protein WISP_01927 [Willisornis vidua]|uniref:Uncharacterized protein n=1 Tax=Willisornis vidua TaxID=1566151 RepID=A0ABQ9DVE8_9PASS|nr:hypothetical protein WISP_01927 [Willisornis vidua]